MKEGLRIFIDPSYSDLGNNRLFDVTDEAMNRDGQMLPFIRLKQALEGRGAVVQTADLLSDEVLEDQVEYWSFGLVDKVDRLSAIAKVKCVGILIMEPPLVAPHLYALLPQLTRQFARVYVHNIQGDGYSLRGVDTSRLRKLFWPQPFERENIVWHRTDRMNKSVVIAGRHSARRRRPEYYSLRIKAIVELAKFGAVDLYGRNWSKIWSAQTVSWPFLRNYLAIQSVYRGPCRSKMDVLSEYRFSLCLENMPMLGYVTEKIFDCFYAGTIPMYLGAPDIEKLIPPESYIDIRQFKDWVDLWKYASNLSADEVTRMRECGRDFISGVRGQQYVQSLEKIFLEDL